MKTIVFLRQSPYPRMYNQAYALKKTKKYKLVLLCRDFDVINLGLFQKVFDEIHCYQPPLLDLKRFGFSQKSKDLPIIHTLKVFMTDDLLGPLFQNLSYKMNFFPLLKKIKADVYNTASSDFLTYVALKHTNKPVVMDLHNGSIMHGIENFSKEQYEKDKYCFEHVSGIIHRGSDYEIKYYRSHGYVINCPLLRYLDYSNREFIINYEVKKLSSEDDEYHIAHMGGGLQTEHVPLMIKKILAQKIHFHLYLVPHSTVWNVYKQYYDLSRNNKYFHLEKNVPFDKVPHEISKYDFGSSLEPAACLDRHSSDSKVGGRSYRLYTYLEAGLPALVSYRNGHAKDMIKKYSIGLPIKDNEIEKIRGLLDKSNYTELKNNVLKAREKLLIDNHVKELDDLYQSAMEHYSCS